jgi:hypothetical protein
MAIGVVTPEYTAKVRRNRMVFLALFFVGIAAGAGMVYLIQPWTEALGVSYSPQRWFFTMLWGVIVGGPAWLYGIYYYSTEQKWLAEDLGLPYEEGKIYPCWTAKRMVSVALGIALFGMSGIVPSTTFDLPQFAATFLTILYGPIEGCIGVGLGFALIRGPLFSGYLSPVNLLSVCMNDGAIYALGGVFYRKFIHPWPTQRRLTLGLALYVLFIDRLHAGWFIPGLYWGMFDFIGNPWEAFLAARAFNNAYWVPIAWLPNIVLSYLVGSALQKYKA